MLGSVQKQNTCTWLIKQVLTLEFKKRNAAAFKNHFESKSSHVFKNSVKKSNKMCLLVD